MQSQPETASKASQQQIEAKLCSKGIEEQIRRKDEVRILACYLMLPPQERVKLWRNGLGLYGSIQVDTDRELIVRGVDAVPYLAEVVRQGNSYYRTYALKILCDMDRFVPKDELVVPEIGRSNNKIWEQFRLEGKINQFMVVDGRRIGREGYEAVKWAAEQTKDKDLRLHARDYSGLLEQELRQLSLGEQIKMWRESVVKSKGILGMAGKVDDYNLSQSLKAILIEQAPASIPALIEMLDYESNGYARDEAVTILYQIDTFRMRLRATENGQKAIEAIHRALEQGGLKPFYRTEEAREKLWRWVYARVFDDEADIFDGTWALALKQLYGVPLELGSGQLGDTTFSSKTLPELRRFATYLTKVDPFFPSWEFTYVGSTSDIVLHPRFKAKMARYYEYWKRFKAEQK